MFRSRWPPSDEDFTSNIQHEVELLASDASCLRSIVILIYTTTTTTTTTMTTTTTTMTTTTTIKTTITSGLVQYCLNQGYLLFYKFIFCIYVLLRIIIMRAITIVKISSAPNTWLFKINFKLQSACVNSFDCPYVSSTPHMNLLLFFFS